MPFVASVYLEENTSRKDLVKRSFYDRMNLLVRSLPSFELKEFALKIRQQLGGIKPSKWSPNAVMFLML